MRLVLAILAALLAIYLGAVAWLVAGSTEASLRVGPIAEALAQQERPADPLELGYRGDPRAALGLDFEDVSIPTELGPAPGWFVDGDRDAAFAAIHVHGIAGAREDGYRLLSLLHDAGVPVLLITYRNDPGAPASPDGRYGFGLTEWRDLEAAVEFLAQRGYSRQIVAADSMGGAILGQFLKRSDRADAVVGVVLDAPALDLVAVVGGMAARHWAPLTSVALPVAAWLMPHAGYVDMRAARVGDVFEQFPGPVFLAHGAGDSVVPVATSRDLAARRQGVTVLLQSAGDHLGSFYEDPRRYGQALGAFLSLLDP